MCALGIKLKTYHHYIFIYDETLSKEELLRRTTHAKNHKVKAISKNNNNLIFTFDSAK